MPAGTPGHHLERDALLVQEQRFLAAAIEHERVAPLQPRDDLAFARLLGEQVADRLLRHRLRRRGADVDQLGAALARASAAAARRVVVDDDVGRAAGSSRPRTVMRPGSPGPAPIR